MSNLDPARVSQLAVVAAHLSDPFVDSGAVLVAHGYTHEMWRQQHEELVTSLARDPALGRRFERAFRLARAAGTSEPAPSLPATGTAEPEPPPAVSSPIPIPTYLRPPDGEVATAPMDTTIAPRSARGPALPFGGAPSAGFRERLASERNKPREPDPSGTLPIFPDAQRDGTLPFDLPPTLVLLKLDSYVALVAELRSDPGSADAIMTRHGLTGARERERVHGLWRTRLSANPDLRERFEQLVAEKLAKVR